jgi:hypothetical protein
MSRITASEIRPRVLKIVVWSMVTSTLHLTADGPCKPEVLPAWD